jgi:EmrB/QacA subfamily drug resistance transporter
VTRSVVADRRRWLVLVSVALSALIVTIDSSVLTVAIPTIMHDFDASLPSVQWVLAGYSLVVASLLIIGGRLGDIFGHRSTFVVGALLFAAGSLLATVSWSVPSLFVGEALIEGLGASLMLPATLAVISITFQGRERAAAFAVWGAVIGFGVAIGPVLGGWLTSELSWRWAFGINLVVAPVSALGVLLFLDRDEPPTRRPRLDLFGAALVSVGLFLLVFGISEGHRYGWWTPLEGPSIAGVAIIPFAFAIAAVLLVAFVSVERRKERAGRDPLFEFGELRHHGYRYGLLTTATLAMGQVGQMFVLAFYLQEGRGLSALDAGLWLLPMGPGIIVGSRLGAAMTHRIGITPTVRWGLVLQLVGLVIGALFVSPTMTFATMCVAIVLFGLGIGIASSQLTNVILSDIHDDKSGVASATNNTVRQVGAALGIAIVGTILATQGGAGLEGVSDATAVALWFTVATSVLGIAFSFLIPHIEPPRVPTDASDPDHLGRTMEMLEAMEAVEPIEPSRDVVLGP